MFLFHLHSNFCIREHLFLTIVFRRILMFTAQKNRYLADNILVHNQNVPKLFSVSPFLFFFSFLCGKGEFLEFMRPTCNSSIVLSSTGLIGLIHLAGFHRRLHSSSKKERAIISCFFLRFTSHLC